MKGSIVAILAFATSQVMAQVPEKLTFRDAVKMGLDKNVTLNQDKNRLAYTQVNKTSSLLQMGPSVRANASVYRNDGNSFNPQAGEVVNGVIDYVNGSLEADMPLFNGLSFLNAHRQAASTNEAQLHQVNRSSQVVIRDIASQYLQCLLDQQLVAIDAENVQAQQAQYNQIKGQVELGAKAEADLYNQEYQLKNAELLLLRSQIKLRNDKATLAQTIQLDPSIPFELEEPDWDINLMVMDTLELPGMYATAMGRRSDLKSSEQLEEARRFEFKSVKGRYFPSLYAGVSYGSRYNYIHGQDNRPFEDQFRTDNRQFGYGLSLSIPIYGGLQTRAQAALSRSEYENAKLVSESTALKVKADVITAYQNFRDAITSYESTQAQLQAAELSYKMEKERYDLGISDLVQLAVVNQAYIKAQGDFQSAVYTLMFQRLMVNFALGTLKMEDIPEPN